MEKNLEKHLTSTQNMVIDRLKQNLVVVQSTMLVGIAFMLATLIAVQFAIFRQVTANYTILNSLKVDLKELNKR